MGSGRPPLLTVVLVIDLIFSILIVLVAGFITFVGSSATTHAPEDTQIVGMTIAGLGALLLILAMGYILVDIACFSMKKWALYTRMALAGLSILLLLVRFEPAVILGIGLNIFLIFACSLGLGEAT
ncbi:hypothetical protein ACFL27_18105 [candidate division CSSED10-310 bacterium]|uniref:Uncharacterized protein n=1 Tax=candidate division CSSED10-310 bacterium TaxID=2855610 RepID=A0ABV6Z0X7_UNCC1